MVNISRATAYRLVKKIGEPKTEPEEGDDAEEGDDE
jgi:hypothetical protein